MQPRINKWLDLLDRAGWTAVQAAIAALVTYLATDDLGWQEGLIFVGTATLAAVAKVLIGQNTGSGDDGSLIGQPVIEPPPVDPS